jgi:hypothetical protein
MEEACSTARTALQGLDDDLFDEFPEFRDTLLRIEGYVASKKQALAGVRKRE